jgi:Protein of unknown function (DUF3618)
MAEQNRAVQPGGSGAVTGRVTQREPDAIVASIDRTRQDLAVTVDALAERFSPAYNARKLRERAAGQFARPQVRLGAAAAGLAVAAVVIWRVWGRRRG